MGSEPDPAVSARLQDAARELDRILESPEFRQSEQSKRLLRYLVEHSLAGETELLRERAIGAALFGLEPGYDTNEKPIVRVRANEIRKRLAKYYQHAGPAALWLEVPAGGYRVEFHSAPVSGEAELTPPEPVPEPAPAPRQWPGYLIPAAVALALIVWFALRLPPRQDPLTGFWRPALENPSPVIICSGHPVVYRYSREFAARIRGREADHYQSQTEILKLSPAESLRGRDIVAIPDQYIGLGSAEAVARICGWLARQGKDADIRFGNDLTFSDLRRAPAVLIGAFQNRWTVEFTRGLRWVFEPSARAPGVRDTRTGQVWSLPRLQEDGKTDEDYVVISRVLRSTSGEFVIAAAGITQYGGHAVGEVLTQPALMAEAVRRAGPGWERRNLQLLYHLKVFAGAAGPPELIAVHSW